VVGGVAANRRLRERMTEEAGYRRLRLYLPELRYCTDNAVMIAAAGYSVWRRTGFVQDPLELDARSRWL
jgi:N6-L-threonylcarbamoyladenine synthase